MGEKNILIVEDEYIVAEDIKTILEDAGYTVVGIVSNGSDAVEALDKSNVDFGLIDIKLPGKLDGIETARIIKEKRQIPFMYITAYVDETTVSRAKLTAPYGYIVKPFSEKELLSNMEMAFYRFQQDIRVKENHDYYYDILKSIGDGVIITDSRDKILFMNSRAEKLLGYRIAEASGKYIGEIYKITPSPRMEGRAIMKNKNGDKLVIEQTVSQIVQKDRSWRDIHNGKVIIFKNAFREKLFENGIVEAKEELERKLLDIRESLYEKDHKLKTLQLKQSITESMKNLITRAIEKIPDVFIIITDTDGKVIYYNNELIKLFLPEKENIENSIDNLLKNIFPAAYRNKIENAFLKRVSYKGKISIQGKEKNYTISLSMFPIKNDSGDVTHFIMIGSDITKETELEKKLIASQKQEAIATLSEGIAHDFNNILGIIVGYTDMMLSETPKDNTFYDSLIEILKAGKRGKELVRQILSFSRETEEELAPIGVTAILKERIRLLRTTLPKTIRIESRLRAMDDRVMANSILLHQIIMNLCLNASHAIKDSRGRIEIELKNINVSKSDYQNELKPGNYLQLTVKDSGSGIKASILDKIFEPYFTTRPVGEGTGLGLYVTHGIVKKLGGCINVESVLGKGSTFKVILPVVKAEEEKKVVNGYETQKIPCGDENIVLIDDEATLVKVWKGMLEKLGYSVTAISDPHEALKYIRDNLETVDLIITDFNMPGINGVELSKKVLELSHDMPIILCSGYGEVLSLENLKGIGIRDFIQKPFVLVQLANSIRRILG